MTERSVTQVVKEWVFDHKGYSLLGVLVAVVGIAIPIYLDRIEKERTAVSELRPITETVMKHAGAIGALLVLDINDSKKEMLVFENSRALIDAIRQLEEFLSAKRAHLPPTIFGITKIYLEEGRDFSMTLESLLSVERLILGDDREQKEIQSDTTASWESLRIKAGELLTSYERMDAEFRRYFKKELQS